MARLTGTHCSILAAPGDVDSLPRSFRLLSDGLLHASSLLPTTPCQGLVMEEQHHPPIGDLPIIVRNRPLRLTD
jgi:hypothetical protein